MKPYLIAVLCSLLAYPALSQQVPGERKNSISQPPLRGAKDLRPRQFGSIRQWKSVADLSAPLKRLQQLAPGESITLGEISSGKIRLPVDARLVKKRMLNDKVTSYYFTVDNPEGSWLYLLVKQGPAGTEYSGSVMNKKYSDALVLQHTNKAYQFSTIEQTDLVTD